jgi:hypothetical protein
MAFERDVVRLVQQHYGPRKSTAPSVGGQTGVFNTKFAEWVYDFDDYPTPDANNDMQFVIPAGSLILGATWKVVVQGVGGTVTQKIGLNPTDNSTPIDDDGLFTTSNIADGVRTLAPTAAGSSLVSAGGQIGSVLTADCTLDVVASAATATAGRYQVIVEYQPHSADGVGSK